MTTVTSARLRAPTPTSSVQLDPKKVTEAAAVTMVTAAITKLKADLDDWRAEMNRRFQRLENTTGPTLRADVSREEQQQRLRRDPIMIFDGTSITSGAQATPGGSSFIDVTGITPSGPSASELLAKRFDALPMKIQVAAQAKGIARSKDSLDMLTVAGMIHRSSERFSGGEKAYVDASDVGRAIGVTTQRAAALMDEAARLGFVREILSSTGRAFKAVL